MNCNFYGQGNITVKMNKDKYYAKLLSMLDNQVKYSIQSTDPFESHEKNFCFYISWACQKEVFYPNAKFRNITTH